MKLEQAIVLAAGLGTRMRPLTETMPKPLIPVQGKPLIDWCLDWLEAGGISKAVVNTSYLAEQLEQHLKTRSAPKVTTSREEPKPLETGGGILNALPKLGSEPFLAMNSDAILPISGEHPVKRLAAAWNDDTDFLMLLVKKENAIGWSGNGDFALEGDRLRRAEKGEDVPYIFTGIELMHPRVFHGCAPGAFSLTKLWDQRKGADGFYQRIRAVVHDGAWINVGDLQGLKQAEAYLAKH